MRRIARAKLRREGGAAGLDSGDLVHEAYVRLDRAGLADPANRSRVLALAAKEMRRVLIDRARRRSTRKRTAVASPPRLDGSALGSDGPTVDALALDQILERLERRRPRVHEVFVLRFFGGMTAREIAECLEVSERTVKSDWAYAKSWVAVELGLVPPEGDW